MKEDLAAFNLKKISEIRPCKHIFHTVCLFDNIPSGYERNAFICPLCTRTIIDIQDVSVDEFKNITK